ncbi:MAG TPA: ABC transporter [Rhodospirillaceae bacterium]|uniref:ABC transporter ATP-binding protein n=1 Tax=Marinobacter sp. G11 TaxID=2903522 RepID=UPI000EED800D|nr:ABC transporter ATP-binding protein [Marinobacter sp. G11]MCE0759962.1 ABC transporter ATP-binding protein [Marinobacter sp. G11]HCI46034.1 ABC transporter [Rhodospirillaceae bacterium]
MSTLHTRDLIINVPGRADGFPLNLSVEPGQTWGVLGPNGAGKTTLLHTLAGLLPARSGRVVLNDAPLIELKRRDIARKLGLVFQERQDSFPATVMETALIGRHPWLSPWESEQADDQIRAQKALAAMDVDYLSGRLLSTLSGGERQRVAIATLMTQNPDIWLLDEPTNHLDLHHQVKVMSLLRDQSVAGKAVFMCLHDLNLAARWCSHVLLLYPNGDACWGPADSMLKPSALEQLYNQKLVTVEADGAPVFVPVSPS